ncbi:MAG TPA: hypothetical protein VF271_06855 [Rhodanobacteraceae bacterium]
MRSSFRLALVASLGALLAACATAPKVPPKPDWQGRTHYQRIQVPAWQKPYQLTSGTQATGTMLKRNPAPVYPPALVAKGLPPVTVTARLSVDKTGHVDAVWISKYQGDAAARAAFEAAVHQAAMHWIFVPLTFMREVTRPDHTVAVATTAKPFSLYFRFYFKVVNGKPVTGSGKAAASAP